MRIATRFAISAVLVLVSLISSSRAQGNIDWEEVWRQTPPFGPPPHSMAWMNDSLSYTRLAYDETRDVMYVVSPHPAAGGQWSGPAIHILDPQTGQPRMDMGRSAHFARRGQGGELPVPLDTFITVNNKNLGFGENWFALYSVDVDEEGRIYACNLVTPIWGMCLLLPGGGCDSMYLGQGPFRVWRWDTPTSTPELIYATCDASHSMIGSTNSSEMPYTRWGDTFAVTGKRAWYQPPLGGPPVLVDSTRIYVSGGNWNPASQASIAVLVADARPFAQRPLRDVLGGGRLSFRLGLQINLPANTVANGLAPDLLTFAGDTLERWIWLRKYGSDVMKVRERQLPSAPLPQVSTPVGADIMTMPNSTALFGFNGAMEFLTLSRWGRNYLAVVDGLPTGSSGLSLPNDHTTARLIDVTTWGAGFMPWGATPQTGNADPWSIDPANYISDVDMKLTYDTLVSRVYPQIQLFVLMSNNGLACYRSWSRIPVELQSLRAVMEGVGTLVEWVVAVEENIQLYLVDRADSENGPWSSVGSVAARGGIGKLTYSLRDIPDQPKREEAWNPDDRTWYRLTAIGFDGSREVFPPVFVKRGEEPRARELSLFPQPASAAEGDVYLRLQSTAVEDVSLRVVDLLGKDVLPARHISVESGRTLLPLRVGKLTAGIYLVIARFEDGTAQVQRLLVR